MGDSFRYLFVYSVLAALMIAGPAMREPLVDHGTTTPPPVDGVSPGTILPDAEGTLLALVNRTRQSYGHRSLLRMDASLRSQARRHSQEMALHGYVGHSSLDGRSVRDRLAWAASPGIRVGENVALAQTVEQGHRAFVASQGHLRNILEPAFRRAGIGVAMAGDMGIMVTEDFTE